MKLRRKMAVTTYVYTKCRYRMQHICKNQIENSVTPNSAIYKCKLKIEELLQ